MPSFWDWEQSNWGWLGCTSTQCFMGDKLLLLSWNSLIWEEKVQILSTPVTDTEKLLNLSMFLQLGSQREAISHSLVWTNETCQVRK